MKTRKTEHNSIKIIKTAALVLLLALLFTPEQMNRTVIAGIAIDGITGSLLFLQIPMLPHISVPAFFKDTHSHMQKHRKNRKKRSVFDRETLLIRQISYQITDKIKAAFPDAS